MNKERKPVEESICKSFCKTGVCSYKGKDGKPCRAKHARIECNAYKENKCTRGDKCYFMHGSPAPVVEPVKGVVQPVAGLPVSVAVAVPSAPSKSQRKNSDDDDGSPGEVELVTIVRPRADLSNPLRTISAVLDARAIIVPVVHRDVAEYYTTIEGMRVLLEGRQRIPHAVDHVGREAATASALSMMCRNLTTASVVSIYGGPRDVKIAEMKGSDEKGARLVVADDVKLEMVLGPDNRLFPGDAGRVRDWGRVEIGKRKFTGAIVVDVYWDGDLGPVTPATYERWCNYTETGEVYVVTRLFRGAAGADFVAENLPVEAVWYRNDDNQIVFSPDPAHLCYPLHFDVNFLEDKVVGRLSISYMKTVGNYKIFKVCLNPINMVVAPVYIGEGHHQRTFEWVVIAKKGWVAKLLSFFPTVRYERRFPWLYHLMVNEFRVLACRDLMTTLENAAVVRQVAGTNVDGMQTRVAALAQKHPECEALRQRFPRVYQNMILGTVMAIMYERRDYTADLMLGLRQEHRSAEIKLMEARSPLVPQQSPFRTVIYLMVFCAIFVFVAFATVFFEMGSSFASVMRVKAQDDNAIVTLSAETARRELGAGLLVTLLILVWVACQVLSGYRRLARSSGFDRWIVDRLTAPGSERLHGDSGSCALSEGTHIPAVEAETVPIGPFRGDVTIQIDGQSWRFSPELKMSKLQYEEASRQIDDLLGEELYVQKTYMLIGNNGMMYQPAKTMRNMIVCALGRIHKPLIKGQKTLVRMEAWNQALYRSRRIDDSGGVEKYDQPMVSREECARALPGKKGKLFLDTAAVMEAGYWREGKISQYDQEVNVKTNETIKMSTLVGPDGEVPSVKPRAIAVLAQAAHVAHAPWARAYAAQMHHIYDGRWFSVPCRNGTIRPVRIWFASGATGDVLNDIARAIDQGDDVIAIAGDDFIGSDSSVLNHTHARFGMGRILEGDLSMCDQSHSEECVDYVATRMEDRGVPAYIADEYRAMCQAPYVTKFRSLIIRGHPGSQLRTGTDFTTPANSEAVLALWIEVFADDRRSVEEIALSLGFEAKMRSHDCVKNATFLKSLFVLDKTGALCAFPMPSAVGKLCKSAKAFDTYEGATSWQHGMKIAAWGAACGCHVPHDYPILGAFIASLARLGDKTSTTVLSASEDAWYKPSIVSDGVDRADALHTVCTRYSVTVDDILRVEALLASVPSLPWFCFDPVFVRLMDVDYA